MMELGDISDPRVRAIWHTARDYMINSFLVGVGHQPQNRLYDPRFDGMNQRQIFMILARNASRA
jgi:hypothetical protein